MNKDIEAYLDTCEHCAQYKPRTGLPVPPTKPITADRIFERIEIDFTSFEYADPNTGDRHIITIVDCFSKFAWAKAFPTQEALPIARYIFELFLNENMFPEILQSDNGKSFLAQIMKELLKLFNIKHKNSRPRHPQTNGQIERFNGTFKRNLREHLENKPNLPWSHLVPIVVAEYNNHKHDTTGRKPVEIFRAFNPSNTSGGKISALEMLSTN
jgi:transposase InsO family protein